MKTHNSRTATHSWISQGIGDVQKETIAFVGDDGGAGVNPIDKDSLSAEAVRGDETISYVELVEPVGRKGRGECEEKKSERSDEHHREEMVLRSR